MAAVQAVVWGTEEEMAERAALCELRWYAAYSAANREKVVADQLTSRGVESFLPLYAVQRRWKDRRVTLHRPLFPGYVFVRLALRDRLQVLQVPGVARLVGFAGRPEALPSAEIETLREALSSAARVEPHPFLRIGRRVRVNRGPFQGMEGILVRGKGQFRVIISVELIMRSVIVDVDITDIEPNS